MLGKESSNGSVDEMKKTNKWEWGSKKWLLNYVVFWKSLNEKIILALYADDIIVMGDNTKDIADLKSFFWFQFHTKDLGCIWYTSSNIPILKNLILSHQFS